MTTIAINETTEVVSTGGFTQDRIAAVRIEAQRTAHLQGMIPGDAVLKEQPMAGRGSGADKILKALNGKGSQ